MAGKEGWFDTEGRPGDRTLQQQMRGLEALWPELLGKSVLDIGCAEGLIALQCASAGAGPVKGVEIVAEHVSVANRLCSANPCTFEVADANLYQPVQRYDVVLMLAILHKLQDPYAAAQRFAQACDDLCVIRLPPVGAPVIRDWRTGFVPFDIGDAMAQCGFHLVMVTQGHNDEWTGFYRRTPY